MSIVRLTVFLKCRYSSNIVDTLIFQLLIRNWHDLVDISLITLTAHLKVQLTTPKNNYIPNWCENPKIVELKYMSDEIENLKGERNGGLRPARVWFLCYSNFEVHFWKRQMETEILCKSKFKVWELWVSMDLQTQKKVKQFKDPSLNERYEAKQSTLGNCDICWNWSQIRIARTLCILFTLFFSLLAVRWQGFF